MRACSTILLLALTLMPELFAQVAFNDLGPSDGTHTNATTFDAGTTGALKNIATGNPFGGTVAVTNVSTVVSTTQSSPDYGTPAFIVFDGVVDFGGGSVEVRTAASDLLY